MKNKIVLISSIRQSARGRSRSNSVWERNLQWNSLNKKLQSKLNVGIIENKYPLQHPLYGSDNKLNRTDIFSEINYNYTRSMFPCKLHF